MKILFETESEQIREIQKKGKPVYQVYDRVERLVLWEYTDEQDAITYAQHRPELRKLWD